MSKFEFKTDLIGEAVMITVGIDPQNSDEWGAAEVLAKSYQTHQDGRPCPDCWYYFGKMGEIRGAYLDSDRTPTLLVCVDGDFIELAAKHVRLYKS